VTGVAYSLTRTNQLFQAYVEAEPQYEFRPIHHCVNRSCLVRVLRRRKQYQPSSQHGVAIDFSFPSKCICRCGIKPAIYREWKLWRRLLPCSRCSNLVHFRYNGSDHKLCGTGHYVKAGRGKCFRCLWDRGGHRTPSCWPSDCHLAEHRASELHRDDWRERPKETVSDSYVLG